MDARTLAEQLKEIDAKITAGTWEWSFFTKPDGSEIKTVEDVAETTMYSARRGSRAELWGVSLAESDDENRHVVIGYTGNGPNAHNNSEGITQLRNLLPNIIEALQSHSWIKITDDPQTLPEIPNCTLAATGRMVIVETHGRSVPAYFKADKKFYWLSGGTISCVKRWTELPAPPPEN